MEQVIINIFLLLGAVKDFKTKRIPVWYLLLGIFLAAIMAAYYGMGDKRWVYPVWVYLLPGVLFLCYRLIVKKGIGYGDGVLLCILGICLGEKVWQVWYISLLLVSSLSVILMILKKADRSSKIAYYPFLWAAHFIICTIR